MSRFAEGDASEYEPEDIRDFDRAVRSGYKHAKGDLSAFLDYLDAMPRKRIVADAFMDRATGDCCAVAEYCRFVRIPVKDLHAAERESRKQREEYDGEEEGGGFEGPTVDMGVKAGLPMEVAHDLGWHNDLSWDRVPVNIIRHAGKKGRYDPNVAGGRRLVEADDATGTHWIERPYTEVVYADMLPEERWLKLRNFIAKKVGRKQVGPSSDWPEFLMSRHAFAQYDGRLRFENDLITTAGSGAEAPEERSDFPEAPPSPGAGR